jgi:hypothetical protein
MARREQGFNCTAEQHQQVTQTATRAPKLPVSLLSPAPFGADFTAKYSNVTYLLTYMAWVQPKHPTVRQLGASTRAVRLMGVHSSDAAGSANTVLLREQCSRPPADFNPTRFFGPAVQLQMCHIHQSHSLYRGVTRGGAWLPCWPENISANSGVAALWPQ